MMRDFPSDLLTADQEQELLARGDYESIVLHNMVLALRYAQKKCQGQFSSGELISLCYVAMSRAIKNFKPHRQRFFSYARVYIKSEVCSEWRKKDPVRGAYKHETELPKDKLPEPLEDNCVEPDLEGIHYKELWAKIEPMIQKLSRKEKMVLELHYKAGLNFRQIGERMGGLTRSRIQQIEAEAIGKLRHALPKGLGL